MKIFLAACVLSISCTHDFQSEENEALAPSLSSSLSPFGQGLKPTWPAFNELVRVTIGPSDQFQLSGDSENFFFTRSQNLANTIMYQVPGGLKDTVALFPTDYDTQDPAWNKHLGQLAFLSFEKSARGRICVWTKATRETDCFDHPGKVSSPVWGLHGEILFLSRSLPWETGKGDAIYELNVSSRLSRSVLRYPHISSFDVHPRTGDIVAVGWDSELSKGETEKPHFLYAPREERTQNYAVVLPFSVPFPGFPATPHFDETGENLYFGQFIDDSNQDAKLDGDDKSVVLLFPFALLSRELDGVAQATPPKPHETTQGEELSEAGGGPSEAQTVAEPDDQIQGLAKVLPLVEVLTFPEQLTPSSSNCLFPEVIASKLFVTCAKGLGRSSLDIYAVDKGGVVPAHWDEAFLFQAREQAREPSEQVLLTNKILYRKASRAGGLLQGTVTAEMRELLKDLILLHSSLGEAFAASDVFARWQELRPSTDAPQSSGRPSADLVLKSFLELQKLRRNFQSDNQSFSYREDLARIEKALSGLSKTTERGAAFTERRETPSAQQSMKLLEFALRVVKRKEDWTFAKLKETGLDFSQVTEEEIVLLAGRVLAWALQDRMLPDKDAYQTLFMWAQQSAKHHERIAVSYLVWGLELLRTETFRGATHAAAAAASFERITQKALSEILSSTSPPQAGQALLRGLAETQIRAAALLSLGTRSVSQTKSHTKSEGDDALGGAFRKLTTDIDKLRDPERPFIYRAHAALLASTLARDPENMSLLMGFHAANWLAKIPLESLEYGIVLENYRKVYLERAYEWWRTQNHDQALDVFYSAVRLTRDEEAHLGLILTSLASSSGAQGLDSKYESLEKALGTTLSGKPIKDALKKLSEYQSERRLRARHSVSLRGLLSRLDEASELLKVRQDSQSVVRDFLQAYIAHERYRISLEPVRLVDTLRFKSQLAAGDTSELVKAIRFYTIALERVSSRLRLRRLVLIQFGELHLLAGQAALASATFESAFAIVSLQANENLRLGLLSARAFALSGRPALAAERMRWLSDKLETAPQELVTASEESGSLHYGVGLQRQTEMAVALKLKQLQAFYLGEAGRFEESCEVVRALLLAHGWTAGSTLPKLAGVPSSAAGGNWEHGAWACFRSKKSEDRQLSKGLFAAVLSFAQLHGAEHAERQKVRGDFLDFSWLQLVARAAGFLAALETDPAQRLSFLQQRKVALEGLAQQELNIAPDSRSLRMALIKTCIQEASLQTVVPARAASIECSLQGLANLQKKGLLLQSRDEFEALKATALLVFAQLRTAAEWESASKQSVKLFDISSSLLPATEEYTAYGPELALSYLKARLALEFLHSAQKVFREVADRQELLEKSVTQAGHGADALVSSFLKDWKDFCLKNWGTLDEREKVQVLKDKVRELSLDATSQRTDAGELFAQLLPWYSGLLRVPQNGIEL